ncbi:MAG: ABC transporter substrate-binding protein [Chloroflexi bacterium]|nr:ABC transporter substrate-binding protein [Chloroflexota bacterium]
MGSSFKLAIQVFSVGAASGLLAAACGGAAAPAATPTKAPAAAATTAPAATKAPAGPKRGGTLRVAYTTVTQIADPHTSTEWVAFDVWRLVSNGLLKEEQTTHKSLPDLATSWRALDDKTWEFKLNQGVKMQSKEPVNGREVTSEDVKYSIQRIATAKPEFVRASWFATVESIDTPDKYTVVMKLKEPFAPLISNLAAQQSAIVPREVVEKQGDLKRPEIAVGMGPFVLESFRLEQGGMFKRNPNYFGKDASGAQLPYLDAIQYDIVEDAQTRVAAFRTGQYDILIGFSAADVPGIRGIPNVTLLPLSESFSVAGMGMDVTKAPFSDIRVRRALHLALDRKEMIDTYMQGQGVLRSPLGRNPLWGQTGDQLANWPGYRQPKDQDRAEAKRLLAEAGYPNGFKFEAVTTPLYPDHHINPALIMQRQWKDVLNVEMSIKQLDWGPFKSQEQGRQFLAEITTLAAGAIVDPDSVLFNNYHTKGSRQYWRLSDPKLDQLIEAQRRAVDVEERKKLVQDAELRIWELLPMIYQAIPQGSGAIYNYAKNLTSTNDGGAFGATRFQQVWLDK